MQIGRCFIGERSLFARASACAIVLAGAGSLLGAQETYDEDEWYDPTDWFDGNNIEWDDTYEWWDEGRNEDDRYGWHYEWDPRENEWEREYGYYDEYYDRDYVSYDDSWDDYYGFDYGDDNRYGWHYEWDPNSKEWDRDYGWYDEYYEEVGDDRGPVQRSEYSITGKIDSFKRVPTENGDRLLVRLRLQDGRTRVVDLGPEMELSRLDLDRGESVTLRGMEVFRTSSIRIAGEPFQLARSRSGESMADGRSSGQESGQMVDFRGKLEGFKELDLGHEKHMLVRMTMQDGSKRVVDLGPRSRLRDLELDQGDQVAVRGQTRDIQGQRVLVARMFTVNDRRFTPEASETTGARTITGEVERFQHVTVEGLPQDHLVLKLEMVNGKTCLVDFGRALELSDLDLAQGAEIRVSGGERDLDGRKVIAARDLQVDEREIALVSGDEKVAPVEAGSSQSDEDR